MIEGLRTRLMQRRALSAYAEGDFATAQRVFRRVRDQKPDAPGIGHNLALTCIALGQYEEAEVLLHDELERFGDHYPRLRVLADLYYVTGDREQANRFYRQARLSEPPAERARDAAGNTAGSR